MNIISATQNYIPFSINGGEKVRIDNSGNVGIGIAAPTVLLDVSGAVKVRGALDMTSQKITNLATPTVSTDVSTKGYVDGVSAVFANLGASATSDGGSNTRIGSAALNVVTGGNNTAIGTAAGSTVTSGTQNVYVGSATTASSATASNEIAIGYGAVGLGSNSAVIGNSSISTTVLRGNVGIGTTTPAVALDVSGIVVIKGGLNMAAKNIYNVNRLTVDGTINGIAIYTGSFTNPTTAFDIDFISTSFTMATIKMNVWITSGSTLWLTFKRSTDGTYVAPNNSVITHRFSDTDTINRYPGVNNILEYAAQNWVSMAEVTFTKSNGAIAYNGQSMVNMGNPHYQTNSISYGYYYEISNASAMNTIIRLNSNGFAGTYTLMYYP